MKQLFPILLLAALLGAGPAQACIKKKGQWTKDNGPLTVLVMDTTQALLANAEVKAGKTALRTRWDGRVILSPAMLAGAKQITVSCEGYKSRTMDNGQWTMDNGQPMVVVLQAKKEEVRIHRDGRIRAAEVPDFKTAGLSASEPRMMMSASEPRMMSITGTGSYMESDAIEMPELSSPGPVSAGLLTAGEVNDFAQWELWKKLWDNGQWTTDNEQEAKSPKDEWGMLPRERYTVQVKNEAGYPVVNYPVSLTDEKGNTLFQAVTDNTGKAELWFGLTDDGAKWAGQLDKEKLQVRAGGYAAAAKAWQTVVTDEPCGASEAVDVLFVFDATGSMGDELRYLQAEMKDVISRATQATGGLAIRTGAVVYRDHTDDYLTRISRLTSDITETQTFISKQSAGGGGDYPEAVPEALMAALNSAGWDSNARARIAFLILDAPCHQDSATLALLHEQVLNAAATGVRIVPVVCSGLSKNAEFLMRSIALATNGTSFFLTDDSGIGHTHLKPTTDSLQVEHLNDMLVRTIAEFSSMPDCEPSDVSILPADVNEQFIPNPFKTSDLEADPTLPHGAGISYLVDISGKLLGIYEGEVPTSHLSTGVYFIKQYIDGQWHTQKILVR